ncbi:MAG: type IV pilus assembly protein PilM [Candidatus Taylorbacteria bacterium]|nr:type IV pilus assembly protein PilM [Candidatus Taylorbacteria bacterium]
MNNPFTNLFSSIFASKDTSVIGIDIGASSLKVVQLKKKGGRAILETYGELAIGPYAGTNLGRAAVLGSDKLVEALKDLLRESNTTTINGGMSIPIGSSLIAFIKMPTIDEKRLSEMVPIEARKYVPVPISEVSLDWWAVPKDESTVSEYQNGQKIVEEKGIEVLLVVIHNDAIAKNKDIQKMTGLNISFSEIEIFSNIRAILEPSLNPQMIMDFGAGSTKMFIVERGILRSSHVINRGSQDITLSISKSLGISFDEAEKIKRKQGILDQAGSDKNVVGVSSITLDYILAEAGRVVMSYYKKSGKKISKIVLTGGGSLLLGLKEKAQNSFETPVEIANPFSKVEYPAFLEEVLKTAGPEFSVAIGLAIRKLQEI